MKNLIKKLWAKAMNFLKWLWGECKDWRTLVLLGFVVLTLSSPAWILAILGLIFNWGWALASAGTIWAFWMFVPGTPFFALSVSITLAIKRAFQKKDKIVEKFDEIKSAVDHTKTEISEKIDEKKDHHNEKKASRKEKRQKKKALKTNKKLNKTRN